MDITTQEELAGALLEILDKDGNIIAAWESTTEPEEIKGLKTGEEYTLRETVAPEGYLVTTDTVFVLDEYGNVDTEKTTTTVSEEGILLVEDTAIAKNAKVIVEKELKYNGDYLYAVDQTFYVALYADEECTQRVTEVKALEFKNACSAQVEFDGLAVGTYYVGECDANGLLLESGNISEDQVYFAEYPVGRTVHVEDDTYSFISFWNEFYPLPEGFYQLAELVVTKEVLGTDGKAKESDEVFYAGIFEDAAYTKLSSEVDNNIIALNMDGESSVSVSTYVNMPVGGGSTTLYITEVDEDGVPVKGSEGFTYTVTVDKESVTFTEEVLYQEVTITNKEIAEEETEKKDAVKTGDESNAEGFLAMFAAAMFAILAVFGKKRRRTVK